MAGTLGFEPRLVVLETIVLTVDTISLKKMAVHTGFEPVSFAVTVRRPRPLDQ